jgi:AcrR family transcriptional regulator
MAKPRLLQLIRSGSDDGEHAHVLDAALAAFLDFGVRRSSMAEIAKRGRLSPATLYRRFAQKTDLVQAVGLREVRRFVADVDSKVDTTAPADEQIAQMFVAFAMGLRRNKLLRRLLDTEPELVLPLLTTRGGPVLDLGRDYLVEFVERLQGEGKLPQYEAAPVAEMCARVALSMALTPQTSIPMNDEVAARQFAREHIALAFGAMPPPATKRTTRVS